LWTFWDGRIQFCERWISDAWQTDELIERAERIDGIPFAPLADTLAYKKMLRRMKDIDDIKLLTDWLAAGQR
jgi:hypothetical protein